MEHVCAFIPLMHVQVANHPEINGYRFNCGAMVSRGTPPQVSEALDRLGEQKGFWIPCMELSTLRSAKGWLWMEADLPHPPGFGFRDLIAKEMVTKLEDILFCISLSGCGENVHWQFGAFCGNSRLYVVSGFLPADLPFRMPWIRAAPDVRRVPWSDATLLAADRIYGDYAVNRSNLTPRLQLALLGYATLVTMDTRSIVQLGVRLLAAVTALEAFFIAPGEYGFIWCDKFPPRIACARGVDDSESTEQLKRLHRVRNDMAHRGGLDESGPISTGITAACGDAERLLRLSLAWALRNHAKVAEAFQRDEWPDA